MSFLRGSRNKNIRRAYQLFRRIYTDRSISYPRLFDLFALRGKEIFGPGLLEYSGPDRYFVDGQKRRSEFQ